MPTAPASTTGGTDIAVVLVDGAYTVRRRTHPEEEDADGVLLPSDVVFATDPLGPFPGATADQGGGRFTFRLDPAAWPIAEDDFLDCPDGTVLVITGQPRLFSIPGVPDVDYIGGVAATAPPQP